MNLTRIDPLKDLADALLGVEKPARYVGGEFGAVLKENPSFTVGIAFPDLYEIGMSNQALRILYNGLNRLDDVACERVFAPAPDFEDVLAKSGVPLYTLERGLPLSALDLLGITMGYELGITGALAILQSGGVPLSAAERQDSHPIVIMGGPAVSNPAPFARFVDAVWIGEAEAGFFDLVADLRDLKRGGARRPDLLARIAREKAVWMPGKAAVRAVYTEFGRADGEPPIFPISNMRVVQDHGAVEIMRGCPNGCRFCHAGLWYRPMRQKSAERIAAEVEEYIRQGGYREITLTSLSSGDYVGIDTLFARLNETYRKEHISFQLPSLKVSSFSLALLEQLSDVRKSGLTFAVETPVDAWQRSINKDVTKANVISILREAKSRGWRSAKFYFMIGLPVGGSEQRSEEEEIVDFLLDVSGASGMHLNVNVGTFVPKPHTPYQWAAQLTEEESVRKLEYIRSRLKRGNFKVGTHDSFTSMLEGIISRGDERVGALLEEAFLAGCRLDAWEDNLKKDVWIPLLGKHTEAVRKALGEKAPDAALPWDSVNPGVGKGFLKREFRRSQSSEYTLPCMENCTEPCGVCADDREIVRNNIHDEPNPAVQPLAEISPEETIPLRPSRPVSHRIVFSFSKVGAAAFIPHLGLIEIFSKAFVRSGLPVQYTEGFNPLPRLNFASPLSVGIVAEAEIAVIEMDEPVTEAEFVARMNRALPVGIAIGNAFAFRIPEGTKKVSAASILWGYAYADASGATKMVSAAEEKMFRASQPKSELGNQRFGLKRVEVLASLGEGNAASYFDAYAALYAHFQA